MIRTLEAYVDAGGDALTPIASQALTTLRQRSG
jgi:hypothetical protein